MGARSVSRAVFLENREEEGRFWTSGTGDFDLKVNRELRSACLFLRFSKDEAMAFLALVSAGRSLVGAVSCEDCEGGSVLVPGWVWPFWHC